jgi:anti-anti-sigma factor
MPIEFEMDQENKQLTVMVTGHLNFSLVNEFRSIYEQVNSPRKIVINLEQSDFIDSSGLGILLYMQKHYDCDKRQVRLINCNGALLKTLGMAQFDKLFTIESLPLATH